MTVIFLVPSSSSTPRIVSLMCAVCILGAASGAGAALSQCVARRTAPPPAALRTLLSKVSAIHTITPDPVSILNCITYTLDRDTRRNSIIRRITVINAFLLSTYRVWNHHLLTRISHRFDPFVDFHCVLGLRKTRAFEFHTSIVFLNIGS